MKSIAQKFGLLAAMLLTVFSAAASYDFNVDGIYYKINPDNITVSVSSPINSVSPSTVNDYYRGNIIIPSCVEYEGKTYSVTQIDNVCTFEYAKSLRSLTLPNSITVIPAYAFYGCSALTNVSLGDGIVSIPQNCFLECKALNRINIPASVETIEEGAFGNCSSLTGMTIPASVTKIYDSAFVGCTALSSLYIADSEKNLMIGYGSYSGTKKGAFDNCPLYEIYIGRNIKPLYTTNQYIFTNHPSLSEVRLGGSVTTLCDELFKGCGNIQKVSVETENLTKIGKSTFEDCEKLSQFEQNSLNNIEEIGNRAFYGCKAITEVILPSIKNIGTSAFMAYEGLLKVVFIGNGLSIIPQNCFRSQNNLKSIYIGNSIKTIEKYALYEGKNLSEIYLLSDNKVVIQENAFSLNPNAINLYVPNTDLYNDSDNLNVREIVTVSNSTFTYSGKVPPLNVKANSGLAKCEIVDNPMSISAGEHNSIEMNFSYLSWNTTVDIP